MHENFLPIVRRARDAATASAVCFIPAPVSRCTVSWRSPTNWTPAAVGPAKRAAAVNAVSTHRLLLLRRQRAAYCSPNLSRALLHPLARPSIHWFIHCFFLTLWPAIGFLISQFSTNIQPTLWISVTLTLLMLCRIQQYHININIHLSLFLMPFHEWISEVSTVFNSHRILFEDFGVNWCVMYVQLLILCIGSRIQWFQAFSHRRPMILITGETQFSKTESLVKVVDEKID